MKTPITTFLQGVLVKSERILTLIMCCHIQTECSIFKNTEYKNTHHERCVLETGESYLIMYMCILYIYTTGDISVTRTANPWGVYVFTLCHIVRFVLLNMQFFMSNIDLSFCLFSFGHYIVTTGWNDMR